ncbi:MAG: DUF4043 family protein [Pseudoalteromonas sp.]|uniref:phage capsid family protein n=1 Tax=Pseudoalteromonas sp. TaxID=53249 RepID=UPI001D338A4A|nr:DUF4043 family protein [Pseudoalteromonas sp.]NRA77876.1 DUF4043 family protein [Pseudoalteromonas sp.]
MATGVLPIDSPLVRNKWMREGLLQKASKSFWAAMTGSTKDAVVYQVNDISAKAGHTVVFDFDGNLSGRAVKGKETATGKGEQKKKFSSSINVERYRMVVDNGDKFDGVAIGDLAINEHSQSRSGLGDLWIRFKDQSLFDSAQGTYEINATNAIQAPSHIIDLGATFTYNSLLDIVTTLKTSQGYDTGGVRRPIAPFAIVDDEPVWLFVIDAHMANVLRQDAAGYQTILRGADVRGNNNRLIKGVIGKLGNLIIIEGPSFFGSTTGTTAGWELNQSNIEISGLRQYHGANPATALWSGQEGFEPDHATVHSRGFILGKGALQLAMGLQPNYKFQESSDFGITSESMLEVWMEVQKTRYNPESGDYRQARVGNIDNGIIAVDLQVGS